MDITQISLLPLPNNHINLSYLFSIANSLPVVFKQLYYKGQQNITCAAGLFDYGQVFHRRDKFTLDKSLPLDQRSFAYWEDRIHGWYVEPGMYVVETAASSRDIRQSATIECKGKRMPVFVTADSTMGDLLKIPGGEQIVQQLTGGMGAYFGAGSADDAASAAISQEMILAMVRDMPLHAMSAYAGEAFSREAMEGLVAMLNQQQTQEN